MGTSLRSLKEGWQRNLKRISPVAAETYQFQTARQSIQNQQLTGVFIKPHQRYNSHLQSVLHHCQSQWLICQHQTGSYSNQFQWLTRQHQIALYNNYHQRPICQFQIDYNNQLQRLNCQLQIVSYDNQYQRLICQFQKVNNNQQQIRSKHYS